MLGMSRRLSRRALLAATGGVPLGVSIAGCLGTGDGNGTDEQGQATESGDDSADEELTPTIDEQYDLTVEHDITMWEQYDPDWSAPTTEPTSVDFEQEIVVENLEIPWDLAFAPNGDLFISERTGRIVQYSADELQAVASPSDIIDSSSAAPGDTEPDWWASGTEGGLMGIAVHPNYPDVPLLYAFYTYDTDDGNRNRLVYYDVSADDPDETATTIIDDIPGDTVHNGCRIAFGPENYLWITMGDVNDEATLAARSSDEEPPYEPVPQDTGSLLGKVLRIKPNGEPAPDNPDFGDGADPRIFSYGHRNPQGISWLPDGTPIITDHGASARDEVKILRPGSNHGWPTVRDSSEYRETEYDRPVINTGSGETWAPSGCVFYTGDAVSAWQNRLLIGTLRGEHINVATIYDTDWDEPLAHNGVRYDADWMDPDWSATSHKFFENEFGRIRHVEQAPTGDVYAITSNRDGRSDGAFPTEQDDVLMRLVPTEE